MLLKHMDKIKGKKTKKNQISHYQVDNSPTLE